MQLNPQQKPLGTKWGFSTTAQEIVDYYQPEGKTIVVTGGYSGLGENITQVLSPHNQVIVPARRPEVAAKKFANQPNITVMPMDLADLNSIDKFATELHQKITKLDILINNAGIMAVAKPTKIDGYDMQFFVNHLGHFYLFNKLKNLLLNTGGTARVISTSSLGHRRSNIIWDDINFTHHPYDKWEAYGQAKTANALFALYLAELHKNQGINAFSLHPGGIMTPLQRHLPKAEMMALGWIDEQGREISDWFKTVPQGAATATWAALATELENIRGVYCEDAEVAFINSTNDLVEGKFGVKDYAADLDNAARLWDYSLKATGLN